MTYRIFSRRVLLSGGASLGLSLVGRRAAAQVAHAAEITVLRARPAMVRMAGENGEPTAIWAFASTVPGPILRARRGEEFKVRVVNDLPVPMSLHWHGVRLPNSMDGVPHLTQAPIEPGASFDYSFRCPDAGTFWYHAPQPTGAARGLSGLLLIDESETVETDRDIALLLEAWALPADGRDEASGDPGLQRRMTANGVPTFNIPVHANDRLRLRLANGSERLASITIDQHRVFVMALDGQPAEPFVARNSRLLLGPGNRADVIFDATLAPGATAPILVATETETRAVARLVYAAQGPAHEARRGDPAGLPSNPLPARMDLAGAVRPELPIGDPAARHVWADTAAGAFGRPLFTVPRGRTVSLAFANRSEAPAVLHPHGHAFRLLDRLDDGWKPFWLDTVVVPPRSTQRVAFVADNPGKWLIDGRILDGRAAPVSAWFEVS